MSPTLIVLLGLLVLANVASIWYSYRMHGVLEELLEAFQPGGEELIGFRSDTAPPMDEEQEHEPEEYLPPGPSIYEEKEIRK